MGGFTKLFWSFFIVLLLLLSTGTGGAEARMCESKSHKYKGVCGRRSNCAYVCRSEGFLGGECRGFRRRCFCTKHC